MLQAGTGWPPKPHCVGDHFYHGAKAGSLRGVRTREAAPR